MMVGPDDYETLPTNNHGIHMTAGAIAGVMEHCVMYPLDSVKTRMQSLSPTISYRGVFHTLHGMMKQEGVFRPVRGMGCVVAGAGPAHALYFACFEHLKDTFQAESSPHPYFISGVAGSIATLLHDAVMTPSEVVKQRIQMVDSPYKGIMDCARQTYQAEGIRAFYRSYTTQLAMNVPFQSIHFMMYDLCQHLTNPDRRYNPPMHMASGAIAGAFAAAVTTPLDVVKTLLNTQQHQVSGMVSAVKAVYRLGGPSGFFRGVQARVLYQMPSTAICWSTYEFFKFILFKNKAEKAERELSAKLPLMILSEVNLEPELPRRTVDMFEWGSNSYSGPVNSLCYTDSYSDVRRDRSS